MDAAAPALGAGRFDIRGTLGTGGAGVVYRAFDHVLGREVALKLLRRASGRDLFRFKREFRSLADIVHPNLVALHELHAAGDEWFFTMELVDGVSFIDWVRPPRAAVGPQRSRQDILASPVSETRLRGALVQLVDALLALHKAGKLHRDLKPSNVLVTAQGRVALLDFGLVAAVAENNPEKLAVGTPLYMSPEQASDQTLGEPSDWYGVGVMLYEALTGRRPFEGESEHVMVRKQTDVPPRPQELAAGVPADLGKLAMELLHPTAAARPTGIAILERLGATPSAKTRDIARTATPGMFVGREKEQKELARALSDCRRRGVAVMVRGKSGIGKSTLVRRFLRGLGEQVFVLEGRCFEREQVPFKMLDGIVDMLTGVVVALPPMDIEMLAPASQKTLPSLVRLFPVLKRVKRFSDLASSELPADPTELRRRGFAALRGLLVKLAKIRPVAIFVDDAHWGDADSVGFLAELVHGADASVLVIVAHRPEDYLGVAAKLRSPPAGSPRRGDVREIELAGLPDDEAIALVALLAHGSGRANDIVRAGAGNPLVLAEMAHAHEVAPADTIDEVIKARAQRLPVEAQAMLAVSAVAARPISIELAARAAGVIGGHDEAQQLVAERLATIRRVDGHMILQPAHDHVRAAVLASIDIETRAGWHEAIAHAFEDGGDVDSQAVVEHWLAAGHPANAAHHAVNAAARAEDALAFRRAAELYEIAITFGPWDAAGRRDLQRKQAHALACAGQLDEAAKLYGEAAELLPGDDDAIDCERLRIEALLRRGRLDDALPAADRILTQLGVRSPLGKAASRTRLATQWMQQKLRGLEFAERDATACAPSDLLRIDVLYSITSGLAFADPALGRVLQSELLRLALECGEPMRVALALAQEVCYSAAAGSRNWNAVDAVGERLAQVAKGLGQHARGLADTAIGIAAYMGGLWREAREHLENGLAALHDHGAGVRWELDIGETYWLGALSYLGEWRELHRQSLLLLRDAEARGDVVSQLGIRTRSGLLPWLVAGRVDDARAQLEETHRSLPAGFHLPHVLAVKAACNIELYARDPAAAGRRLDSVWPEIERLGATRLQHLRVELLMLRARILLADQKKPDRAKHIRGISDELVKEGAPWSVGLGLSARAGAYALRGDRENARAWLAAAEEQFQMCGMLGWLHVAKLRRASLEGGPGGSARAAAARDFLGDLGAADPDAVASLLLPWPG
jgi:serine/threonine protein kinase/tetratricopeptide (TPR) repeat protein